MISEQAAAAADQEGFLRLRPKTPFGLSRSFLKQGHNKGKFLKDDDALKL